MHITRQTLLKLLSTGFLLLRLTTAFIADIDCGLPPDSGDGISARLQIRYYYESHEMRCKTFSWNGGSRNANNFNNESSCNKACFGSRAVPYNYKTPAPSAYSLPSQRTTPISGCSIPKIQNVKVKYRNQTIAAGTSLPHGSQVALDCEKNGYVISNQINGEYICKEDGTWSTPLRFAKCVQDFGECGVQQIKPRIYGGGYAAVGELPWMAKLDLQFSAGEAKQCGAFLISSEWLLTAAHCVESGDERPISVVVRLGKTNLSSSGEDANKQIRTTSIYCVHPEFNANANYNFDVALIRLNTSIAFQNRIRPICLPEETQCSANYLTNLNTVDGCSHVGSAGWGLMNASNIPILSQSLRTVNLTIYSRDECKQLLRRYRLSAVSDAQICAGSILSGQDTCIGDSGGPLQCVINDKMVAIGIVSMGLESECGRANVPAIYARICRVLPWIKAVRSGNGECNPPSRTTSPPIASGSAETEITDGEEDQ